MKKKKQSEWRNVLAALLVMATGGVLVNLMLGLAVSQGLAPENMMQIVGIGATEFIVFLVCYVTAKKTQKGRVVVAALLSSVFLVFRLSLGAIFYSEAKINAIGMLATIGVGTVAGLLAGMKKQRRR